MNDSPSPPDVSAPAGGALPSIRVSAPRYTPEQTAELRAFYEVLEPCKERINREVYEAATRVPAFLALSVQIDPATRAAQEKISNGLERDALVDGRWEGFLENLSAQGAFYARLGVAFADWYALLTPYRAVLHDQIFAVHPGATNPRAALAGMGRFLDVVMSTIAAAYLETKEALVREAEAQLGLYVDLFRNASVGMLVYEWTDPPDRGSFRLVAVNPAAAQLGTARVLGHVGRTIRETNPELLDLEVLENYAAAVDLRESRAWTMVHGTEESPQFYEVRCFPLQQRYLGVLFENATARRRLASQLERHVQELQRSNSELDDFAYVASHDLKAPLRDIDNLAAWIAEDAGPVLPEPSRRHLAVLQSRVGRLDRLLDDLLEYARAGRSGVASERFVPGTVIEEVLRLLGPRPGFEVHVNSVHPAICTPRVPFAVLLRNLVDNAIKHHHRPEGRVRIEVSEGPVRLTVSVTDDGPGIPVEFHERVFRMFHTLRPRDQVEGSGAGLAIVKKLVELHGGVVWLESEPGKGTTVRFTWPKVWPAPSGGSPS